MRVSSPDEEAAADNLLATTLRGTLRALKLTDPAISYTTVGARVGEPKQHVGEWCDTLSDRRPRVVQLMMLGPKIAPAVFRALAAAIEATVEAAPSVDIRELALTVQTRVGELAKSVNEAWRDRKLSLGEIEDIEARCHATNAETSNILAVCAQARAALRVGAEIGGGR